MTRRALVYGRSLRREYFGHWQMQGLRGVRCVPLADLVRVFVRIGQTGDVAPGPWRWSLRWEYLGKEQMAGAGVWAGP